MFYSQANQDKWVCDMLDNKRNGFFVDIGAYDGIQTSNTYHLEKELGWKGICIEGNYYAYEQLVKNRNSININEAVTDYKGVCLFGVDRIGGSHEINCDTLLNILNDYNAPEVIDYLSIDIEGHEFTVLSAFDFSRYDIKLMTVEHNLYCNGPENKNKLFELLTSNGFFRVVEDALCLDHNPEWYNKPYEDWYAKL